MTIDKDLLRPGPGEIGWVWRVAGEMTQILPHSTSTAKTTNKSGMASLALYLTTFTFYAVATGIHLSQSYGSLSY
jgi:hypothetical protein